MKQDDVDSQLLIRHLKESVELVAARLKRGTETDERINTMERRLLALESLTAMLLSQQEKGEDKDKKDDLPATPTHNFASGKYKAAVDKEYERTPTTTSDDVTSSEKTENLLPAFDDSEKKLRQAEARAGVHKLSDQYLTLIPTLLSLLSETKSRAVTTDQIEHIVEQTANEINAKLDKIKKVIGEESQRSKSKKSKKAGKSTKDKKLAAAKEGEEEKEDGSKKEGKGAKPDAEKANWKKDKKEDDDKKAGGKEKEPKKDDLLEMVHRALSGSIGPVNLIVMHKPTINIGVNTSTSGDASAASSILVGRADDVSMLAGAKFKSSTTEKDDDKEETDENEEEKDEKEEEKEEDNKMEEPSQNPNSKSPKAESSTNNVASKQHTQRDKAPVRHVREEGVGQPAVAAAAEEKSDVMTTDQTQEDTTEGPATVDSTQETDEVAISTTSMNWTDKGGIQTLRLTNNTKTRQAIKLKCTDNKLYVINPVFTSVEPGKDVDIVVTRAAGPVKTDKIVVCVTECSETDTKDMAQFFKKAPPMKVRTVEVLLK